MQLGLTKDQIAFRKNAIGGSDANVIMGGNDERILRLWREKRGESEPEDLSDILPVQMGSATEAFNRYWFTRRTGIELWRVGDEELSFDYPWMSATLDGETIEKVPAYFDAKHVNAFAKEDETLAKYMPQLHHNMIVTSTRRAVLSVFYGTLKWSAHWVDFDPMYAESVLASEERFWDCVQSGEPPVVEHVVAAPIQSFDRVVDMKASNSWSSSAFDWLQLKDKAKAFDEAVKAIKEMVEPDVKEASGHGILVTRNAAGSLSIKKAKA